MTTDIALGGGLYTSLNGNCVLLLADEFELKLLEQKKERERVFKMKEERRRQAARERLNQQSQETDKRQQAPLSVNGRNLQKSAKEPGVGGDASKASKEEKQKRQVILTNVDESLDEKALTGAFKNLEVDVS